MAHLIFRLRNVPEDEAEDVRRLLESSHIEFYETGAGNWGISMPGFWLQDNNDAARARVLIEDYQQKRRTRARETGNRDTLYKSFMSAFRQRPLHTAGLLLFCAALLFLMTKPFLALFASNS